MRMCMVELVSYFECASQAHSQVPIDDVKRAWTALAEALCNEWNVFAVDPQNEPWKSTWGFGDPKTDWNLGAEDLGNHILSVCPRWLIFVEGVSDYPGSRGPMHGTFWGENLQGARDHPVRLRDPSKLVYRCASHGGLRLARRS